MIPEMRVGEEAMRRLWLVEVGVEGVLVPVPALDSEVLTAGPRDPSPKPRGAERKGSYRYQNILEGGNHVIVNIHSLIQPLQPLPLLLDHIVKQAH